MAEEHRGVNKPFQNSLLSAAATGFSFEDSAALLVPVSLQDEPDTDFLSGEIDLNDLMSEDLEDELDGAPTLIMSSSNVLNPVLKPAESDISLSSIFSQPEENDPFTLSLSNSNNSQPGIPPSIVNQGLKESKSSDTIFSLSSLWSSGRLLAPTAQKLSPVPVSFQNQPIVPTGVVTDAFGLASHSSGLNESNRRNMSTESPSVVSNFPYSLSSPNLSSQAKEGEGIGIPQANQVSKPILPPVGPSGANNFRLGSQRPVYAQYPGLMGNNPHPVTLPSAPSPSSLLNESLQSPPVSTFTPDPSPSNPFTSYSGVIQPMQTSTFFQNLSSAQSLPDHTDNSQRLTTSSSVHNLSSHTNQPSGPFVGSTRMHQMHQVSYSPVSFHWFHRKDIDSRPVWKPFSLMDSVALEDAYSCKKDEYVATDGGRYDVDVNKRQKMPIYWDEEPSEVRRCSWFYKGPMDSRFIPYDEELSKRLENEYQQAMTTGVWHKRLEFPGGEAIVLHNPNAMAHFCQAAAPDEWGNLPESQLRPRVVKRGVDEFEIEDGESKQIDHLVFLVHGIGAICDFKFRTIVEAVDDFRHLSFQLMQSHFKDSVDLGRAGRIEFLPVSWHKALHGDGGIDQKLKPITLKSIPKLRNFTNDTLLDILFYTSPVYAQTIVDTVGNELNRLFNLFLTRNPTFNGYVALSGHSLGSLILFDLLAHQPKIGRQEKPHSSEPGVTEPIDDKLNNIESKMSSVSLESTESSSRMVSYTVGSGTGQPVISYPTLEFEPTAFFALGSPIAMFVTVRGIDRLGEDFHFPTCPAFFNIFHPFDPVAYRIETLIEPNSSMRPILIPHHKGRKRFHLELKETMQRVGSDIKQKFLDSLKTTWNTVYQLATFSKGENFEQEIDRVIEGELVKKSEETASNASGGEDVDQDVGLGKLNGGRRIDYVLQEAPLESFNEYLFALSSHVCYWESEDTMLMIMREIYASMGIFVDTRLATNVIITNPNHSNPINTYHHSVPPQPFINANNPSIGGNGFFAGYPSAIVNDFEPPPTAFTHSQPPPVFPNPVPFSTAPPLLLNPGTNEANTIWPNSTVGPPILMSDTGKPPIIGARPVVSPETLAALRGMDPTAPIGGSSTVGPPPLTGFVRKS